LLIGLPGSKSSLQQLLAEEDPRRQLISTDAIRSQLFGEIQGPWLLVWQGGAAPISCVQISRAAAREAIYDATNAQRRHGEKSLHLPVPLALPTLLGCG